MLSRSGRLLAFLCCLWLAACQSTPSTPPAGADDTANERADAANSAINEDDVAYDGDGGNGADAAIDPVGEVIIFYTNDEHGWMEGVAAGRGAADLMGLWADEGYAVDDDMFLLLSGGDNWTGPAISTWFQGASMLELMNGMGYRAAAVGNHEFDFGLDVLTQNAAAADFPYLSANVRWRDGRLPTDLGIEPFAIIQADVIEVGVIGLTTTLTPNITKPSITGELVFLDYETALREIVPAARAAGAELIVVVGHICQAEVTALARAVADLGIGLIGGGHCNELFAAEVGDTIVLGGGDSFRSYAWAEINYDTVAATTVTARFGTAINEGGDADPATAALIEDWRAAAAAELDEVIGYTAAGIEQRGRFMQALVTEAWLANAPYADIALTNLGGLRADIAPGPITRGDVIGVLPFDNVLVEVALTGQQVEAILRTHGDSTAVGGMSRVGGEWTLHESDAPLSPDETYLVLINDFMYTGGDGYPFADFDPAGYNTGVDWRQPVWDWLLVLASSEDQPLESLLDPS